MSDNLSHSITNAILAFSHTPDFSHPKASEDRPVAHSSHKATNKTHNVGEHTSKTELMDRLCPVTTEDMGPPRKRATRRAKAEQTWKRAKALTESSDSGSDSRTSA
ncbi:Hypothetical predicted protein, partial [Pelobates cultripes]